MSRQEHEIAIGYFSSGAKEHTGSKIETPAVYGIPHSLESVVISPLSKMSNESAADFLR